MYSITNLFTGEHKELERFKEKCIKEFPPTPERQYTDFSEKLISHFYIKEECDTFQPSKWASLMTGSAINFAWSAEDAENSIFLRTECDTEGLLPMYYTKIRVNKPPYLFEIHAENEKGLLRAAESFTGKAFTSVKDFSAYKSKDIMGIEVFPYKLCDLFGNVLQQGDEILLMYEYVNIEAFVKWLNFKLRNNGIYEVTESNVRPYLADLEFQRSNSNLNCCFVLPCFATKSGEYEVYKYKYRCINGKDTICF